MYALVKRGRRAHNLLEVVVASFILATALIFIASIWATYHGSLTKSKNMLVATGLARSVIEQHVASGYGALGASLNVPQTSTIVSRSQVRGRLIEVPYQIEVYGSETPEPSTRRLRVKVEWEEARGGTRAVRYETFLFRTQ
jgi:hypothetical protein